MQNYLRFLLYTDPSRTSTVQIHPNIVVDEPPRFGYGQGVRVGDDADDPDTWPHYVVAYITRLKQIEEPNQPGVNALLFTVYLAKKEEWPDFEFPQELKDAGKEREM